MFPLGILIAYRNITLHSNGEKKKTPKNYFVEMILENHSVSHPVAQQQVETEREMVPEGFSCILTQNSAQVVSVGLNITDLLTSRPATAMLSQSRIYALLFEYFTARLILNKLWLWLVFSIHLGPDSFSFIGKWLLLYSLGGQYQGLNNTIWRVIGTMRKAMIFSPERGNTSLQNW